MLAVDRVVTPSSEALALLFEASRANTGVSEDIDPCVPRRAIHVMLRQYLTNLAPC